MMGASLTRYRYGVLLVVVFYTIYYLLPGNGESSNLEPVARVSAPSTPTSTRPVIGQADDSSVDSLAKIKADKDFTIHPLDAPVPRRDFNPFARFSPHNAKDPSGYAFATLLCTPTPHERDPFWAATQQLVWRILWSNWHSTHPVIVFVCPNTPEWQRTTLSAQGAIVKDIKLIDNVIDVSRLHLSRWKDQLAKLNMWTFTEFKRIAFLDSDAFPIQNIDSIFDVVPVQDCDPSKLSTDDKAIYDGPGGKEFCRYTFGGAEMSDTDRELNGGVFVFQPSLLWHRKLTRDATKTDQYDSQTAEQGLLNSKLGFGLDGPFPRHTLSQAYNADKEAFQERKSKTGDEAVKVAHCKLWSPFSLTWAPELSDKWDVDWMSMCRFYDSDVFADARITGVRKEYLDLLGGVKLQTDPSKS